MVTGLYLLQHTRRAKGQTQGFMHAGEAPPVSYIPAI